MLEALIQAFLIIFLIQLVFFLIAVNLRTDKFTDITYGSTFVLVVLFNYLRSSHQLIPITLTVLISIWGVRLAGYLFIRIIKIKKDERFNKIRGNFIKFGLFWILQAITIWVILLPAIVVLNKSERLDNILPLSILGFVIWVVGFAIETIADQQKYNFKSDINNREKWIQSGIWKYSRHPNYFGEILVWWGIFLICLPYLSGIYYLTIASPVFITSLLLFVSGIPIIEKKYNEKYKNNSEYQNYKKNTSILIPFLGKI